MKKNNDNKKSENRDDTPDEKIYEVLGETDDEIILQINKRKDENQALKKLLENLNSNISKSKTKKNV